MNHLKTIALASIAAMTLFSCKKEVINKSVAVEESKTPKNPIAWEKVVSVVWGLGTDNRVYRWNASSNSWNEPSPSTRLVRIAVGQNNGAAVWGIGTDGRIYQWNGAFFYEPNSAARLSNISAYSSDVAYGVSQDEKILFKTIDGGVNWTTVALTGVPNPATLTIKSVSTMRGNDIMIVTNSGEPYYYTSIGWQHFGITGSSMNLRMASGWTNECWAVKNPSSTPNAGDVLYHNGSSWSTPNPAAQLATVSMSDDDVVWATGGDNRVYRWNASTNSWNEPNPAAGLKVVSSGN
ncbi:hypothetical protein D3C87_152020 [compost metagenome]